jgi:hypothetical protein
LGRGISDRPACGLLLFPHYTDETKAFARQCLDEALLLSGIADRASGGIQASRQCNIRDNAPAPNGTHEFVLTDDALPVSDQVVKQVKSLRANRDRIHIPMKFTPFRVEGVVFEEIAQAGIPSWWRPWRMNNKPPVRKM